MNQSDMIDGWEMPSLWKGSIVKMTPDTHLNHLLHTHIMKGCWHEFVQGYCVKCQKESFKRGDPFWPDYLHNPSDYWKLLQKVSNLGVGPKDWIGFFNSLAPSHEYFHTARDITKFILLDQRRGCESLADFFIPGWRDQG